eukprot:767858-Hanusia_phi.AAC.8
MQPQQEVPLPPPSMSSVNTPREAEFYDVCQGVKREEERKARKDGEIGPEYGEKQVCVQQRRGKLCILILALSFQLPFSCSHCSLFHSSLIIYLHPPSRPLHSPPLLPFSVCSGQQLLPRGDRSQSHQSSLTSQWPQVQAQSADGVEPEVTSSGSVEGVRRIGQELEDEKESGNKDRR